jgi:sulfate permease, SulP family
VTAVAVITVAASVVVRRHLPRLPHLIAAMLAGSVAAAVLNHVFGPERTGVATIDALSIGLPPLSVPDLSLATIEKLVPIAIALALLALTEAVSIARAIALKSGQRIDGSQEFIGQGLANLAGAFFSGYASSGSFNRSGLNHAAGAQTPLAAALSAVFLLLIMLFLAPYARLLPIAAMAGILFVVAWGLVDFHHIGEIMRASRQETTVLASTFVATLTLDLEFAIYIGVLLSLFLYLNRTSKPGVEEVRPLAATGPTTFGPGAGDDVHERLKIVRVNGSIFFGAVNHLQEAFQAIDERDPAKVHLLLVASGINFVDLAGAQMLGHEARRRRALGGGLYIFNMKEEPLAMLRRSGQLDVVGPENFYRLGDDVMGLLLARLG